MTITAIGFDIDGTLYPNLSLWARLALPALRNLRLLSAFARVRRELREFADELDPAQARTLEKVRTLACVRYLMDAHGLHELTSMGDGADDSGADVVGGIADFRRFQASLVARRLGIDEDDAASLVERVIYRDFIEVFSGVKPFAGVAGALASFRSMGIKLGAMSDLPAMRKLELLDLAGCFDLAFTSEETGFLKPSPEPFVELASRLGERPENILYVGNSEAYDVAGARAAGMRTALVSRLRGRTSAADLVFFDYGDLVARVERVRS
ncbi:MAG: HAD family hydrolase [Spirochaetes bacterium]|nr:HAD family hydrolase [Spirochaetota bacterium]